MFLTTGLGAIFILIDHFLLYSIEVYRGVIWKQENKNHSLGALLEFDMKTIPHYLKINGIPISDVYTPYIPCFKTHSFKYGFRDFRHTKLTLKTNKQRKTDCVTKQTILTYTVERYFRNLNSESWCSSSSAFHPYKNAYIFICVCLYTLYPWILGKS